MNRMKWKIAVLCGGDSSERDVSLRTGEAVAAALDELRHYVRLIDVRNKSLAALDNFECDLAFIAMHGAFGEDGQLQLLLETRGIPYTGSGVEASRLAMDKAAAKERFVNCGIPTPEYAVVRDRDRAETVRSAVVGMGFPQVIKPACEGSSVAVTVARSMPEALEGLELVFPLDDRALIERFIRGRELTVGILGRRALPIIELKYPSAIFDYHAKYTDGATQHIINPDLPPGVADLVRTTAFAAHGALGCRDLSRVDIILDARNRPYVLEINTIPGMTETSLVPDAARAAGTSFGELCETIARYALRRAPEREQASERGMEQWLQDEKP